METDALLQGDCFDLISKISDKSIDLVVTDPPYEHVMGGMKSKRYNVGETWNSDSYMNMKMSQFKHDDIFEFLDLVIPKMKKVNMFVFCSKLQLAHFMGSGSTGVAAINLNRKFIGMELNQDYFNVAQQRIRKAKEVVA